MSRLKQLIVDLFDCGAVKIDTVNGFKLKLHETNPTAPLSPIYLNLRTPENPKPGPLTGTLVKEVAFLLWELAKEKQIPFQAVAGLPNAGTPLAGAFRDIAIREGHPTHLISLGKVVVGGGRKIEGILDADGAPTGTVVLVIDDLITRGDSKNEGIHALVNAGYVVDDVLVAVDREQGGTKDLEQKSVWLSSLISLRKIVELLCEAKKITPAQQEQVLSYLSNQ